MRTLRLLQLATAVFQYTPGLRDTDGVIEDAFGADEVELIRIFADGDTFCPVRKLPAKIVPAGFEFQANACMPPMLA